MRDTPFLQPITAPVERIEHAEDETPQCYICGTDDPEDGIEKVEFPEQVVDVCGRCQVSWQHQERLRQEYGLAESEV